MLNEKLSNLNKKSKKKSEYKLKKILSFYALIKGFGKLSKILHNHKCGLNY